MKEFAGRVQTCFMVVYTNKVVLMLKFVVVVTENVVTRLVLLL